jgi:hypothetical protein
MKEKIIKMQDKKQVLIKGSIGGTDRQNRDASRVLSGGGAIYTLLSHTQKQQPMVIKKWKRK